jgi:ribonuclease P protein component
VKKNQTFPREEKLKSKKMIGNIFSNGFVVKSYPIRIQFTFHEFTHLPRCQVGVSVSKRNFKSAVDRNRIKRQLREVYRLNKTDLINKLEARDKHLAMMIIYTNNEKWDYSKIATKVNDAFGKIRI